ncbi:ABC transporter permease [Mucilaginibacter sp.]|uniref:ABC transporter permease n=1 Tax=Mucilaginibacter sp. TaxID=1882438 RepID=UPI002850DBF8|nr:ABC transporter permease [Mucilaginibacter sp.]MDR3696030.1 ABC transporter permease [Mucilaginibacter sp.]
MEQRLTLLMYLNAYTFHITPYDLAFLGTIFIGLTFTLQLWFTKRINQTANRFLGLALATIVLWMAWVLGIDIRLGTYFPHWNWLPLQFSLTLGPLIYFYVLKITRPEYKLRWKDLLHFSPLLLEQGVLVLEVRESIRTGAATYDTLTFQQLSAVLQLAAFISVTTYLYWSFRLIENFYQRLKFNNVSDRYRYELRWIYRLLTGFGLLWLLWIPCAAVDYFYYHGQMDMQACYPLYLLLAIIFTRIAIVSFLRPDARVPVHATYVSRPLPPVELKQKGIWLKKVVKENCYYEDPELSLGSLAEKLDLTTHELSRIINAVLKKSFNDFINEYRIAQVIQKMQNPVYDRLTLLGIAFDSGFNSKTTFSRAFRRMTGKTPGEYSSDLKKEGPSYNLNPHSRSAAIVSCHEVTPKWSYEKLTRNFMFRNYLKTTLRSLSKNRAYSFLNIAGLAVGITCAGLIFLWVGNELTYDNNNAQREKLYSVQVNQISGGNTSTIGSTPRLMAAAIKAEIPGIVNTCRISDQDERALFNIGDNGVYASGKYSDSSLFSMFTLPFIEGNAATAFSNVYSIVVTEKTAVKFFGSSSNVIGKTVRMNNKQDYVVTGVLKDLPENSTLQFEWLAPYQANLQQEQITYGPHEETWDSYGPFTYVQLASPASLASVNKQLFNFIHQRDPKQVGNTFLFPMRDWHLYSEFANGRPTGGGKIKQVRMLAGIALIILLVACINFMNLSTARSEKRAKEIGVRKVLGSGRKRLILQFIAESFILSCIAALCAVVLMAFALPAFNSLVQENLILGIAEPFHWIALLLIVIICGLVAGSYPALYLSSFDPLKILKGLRIKTGHATLVRQSLVVLQFTVSVIFIISTYVIYLQLQHVKNRNLGFNKDNLLEIDMQHAVARDFPVIKSELLKTGLIDNAAMADHTTIDGGNTRGDLTWPGKSPDAQGVSKRNVSAEFISTSGMRLLKGRDFNTNITVDNPDVVISESLAKLINKDNPIGQIVRMPDNNNKGAIKNFNVIGVVADYIYGDMYSKPLPVIFFCQPPSSFDANLVYVRIKEGHNSQQTLANIAAVLKKTNPAYPFQYKFVDDQFNTMFADEMLTSKLSGVFAILAIFISCLGLFSLAAYTAERRLKEIGVRKVLGSSVAGIAGLLSKGLMQLVGISCIIAFPVAWWIMHNWLQGYEYRISIHWWIFAIAGFSATLIALVTVSFQAIKAALINPVKSLRSE